MTLQLWGRIDIMAILDNQHCLIRFLQPLLRPGDELGTFRITVCAPTTVPSKLSLDRTVRFGRFIDQTF